MSYLYAKHIQQIYHVKDKMSFLVDGVIQRAYNTPYKR